MSVDHGHFCPLPRVALAVFVAARAAADDVGQVENRHALAEPLGISPRGLRRWFGVLEQRRWRGRSLLKRRGADALWVLLADMPGIPHRPKVAVVDEESVDDGRGGPTTSSEWRGLRAQIGGVKRALTEAQRQRDAARGELQRVLNEMHHEHRESARLGAQPEVVALRADLEHAADCLNVDCERCDEINARLDDGRPRYATAVDLAERLNEAELIARAGAELIAAVQDRGVGARSRHALALAALAAAVKGERGRVVELLEEVGRR